MPREDPRDVVLLSQSCASSMIKKMLKRHQVSSVLNSLPEGAVVGTSSLRRAAFISRYFPCLQTKILRGNIHTRLSKLDSGGYDAIILAAAGLRRLGMEKRIGEFLEINHWLPAAGQGAIGIEIRKNRLDLFSQIFLLNDLSTALAVCAEREASRCLGGGCDVPLGSYAQWLPKKNSFGCQSKTSLDSLELRLFVSTPDALESIEVSDVKKIANFNEAVEFGRHLGDVMRAKGAASVIKHAREMSHQFFE